MRTLLLAASMCVAGLTLSAPTGTDQRALPHRSPCDLALLPGGRLALTANQTSDSASLVDLVAGKVLDEIACGRRPAAVACSADGRRAAISNLWSGTVTVLAVDGQHLRSACCIDVGPQP